jgi:glycosyltransferase involved in cell wall biosynthesis/Tfp pilus assembly protein PilF
MVAPNSSQHDNPYPQDPAPATPILDHVEPTPDITALIYSYNFQENIRECIESVLGQTLRPATIAVYDDCSSDGSWAIIESLARRYPEVIKAHRHPRNIGVTLNLNYGMQRARGDLITWIDGADRWNPRKLELEWQVLRRNPACRLAFSNVRTIEASGEVRDLWDDPEAPAVASGDIFHQVITKTLFPRRRDLFRNHLQYRQVFDQIGFMDENLRLYVDWDFKIRAAERFKAAYTSVATVDYRVPAGGIHSAAADIHRADILAILKKNIPLTRRLSVMSRLRILDTVTQLLNKVQPHADNRRKTRTIAAKAGVPLTSLEDYDRPATLAAPMPPAPEGRADQWLSNDPAHPRISVFITSYNQEEYLAEAIESVLAQTLRPWEIIIVDDASTDGSPEVIRQYVTRYPKLVRGIYHARNTGVTQSRIDALNAVTGDFVTYVDGDDRFLETKLEKEYAALRSRPGAQIAFSNNYYMDVDGERTKVWIEDQKPPEGMVFMQTFGRLYPKMSLYRMELADYHAWKSIGFHDRNLTIYEDFDMRIRMTKTMQTVYHDEPLSEIRDHGTGLSSSRRASHHRSLDYIFQKNRPLLMDLDASKRKAAEAGFRLWARKVGKQVDIQSTADSRTRIPRPSGCQAGFRGQNLIFLISQPRAGSTLLQRIIAGHTDVHSTAEPWIMLHPLHALKRSGIQADYRAPLARQGLEDFLSQFPEGEEVYIESLRSQAAVLYGRALDISGKSYFLDKTPRYYHIIPELFRVFPEARFIFLLRNPISVLASILKTWLQDDVGRLDAHLRQDLYEAPRLLLEGVQLLKENAIVVNYENLVLQPEEVVRRLCIRLDLSYSPTLLDYGFRKAPAGRFGDPLNVHRHQRPVSAYVDKWEQDLHKPESIALALDYLQRLGPQSLAQMGYVFADVEKKLRQAEARATRGHEALDASQTLVRRGEALAARDDLTGAEALFAQALALDPDNADAHNNMGVIHYRLGDFPRAAEDYGRAVALKPGHLVYKKNLADLCCFATGQTQQAVALYQEIIAENPEDIEVRLGLASVCIHQGQMADARFFCDQVLQLDPENRDALQMRAMLESPPPAGDDRSACRQESLLRTDLKNRLEALKQKPDDVETLLAIGGICTRLGRVTDALDFYLRVLKNSPGNPAATESARRALAALNGQVRTQVAAADHRQDAGPPHDIIVSAIVSVYQAERFIRGCLEDLENQTIARQMEIIVIDSASPQNEAAVVREFQARFDNIRYIRTDVRETVYAAWNRGVRAARGKYVTNANADDRHMPDAFAVMSRTLDENPDVALVYADCIITDRENETFDACTPAGAYRWLEWDRQRLLQDGCFMGPQPMWRRCVHAEYGDFDASLVTSGDYEFWLRISQTHAFRHIPRFLGLYLRSPGSVEHTNHERKQMENRKILEFYRHAHAVKEIVRRRQAPPPAEVPAEIRALVDQAQTQYETEDFAAAYRTLQTALALAPEHGPLRGLLVDVVLAAGDKKVAATLLQTWETRHDPPPAVLVLMGRLSEALGDTPAATHRAEQAIALDPGCAGGWNLAGVLACRQGATEAGLRNFGKAAELDPAWGEPWTNMGVVHWENDRPEEALTCLEKGLRLSPTAANAATAYHTAVAAAGQYARALEVFRGLTARRPRFRKGRYLLIDSLIHLNDHHGALEAIEAVIRDFGSDTQLLESSLRLRAHVGPATVAAGKPGSISLCMIVRDEQANLPRCLSALKPLVDELVVVDTGSSDHTRGIAEVFGARLFDYQWNDDFAAARNVALANARGEWILVLDADEVVATQDHARIRDAIAGAPDRRTAFAITTRNYTLQCNSVDWQANDGRYTEEAGAGWFPSEKVRLFPNAPAIRFEYPVHELVDPALARAGYAVVPCSVPVHHYGKLDAVRADRKGDLYYAIGQRKLSDLGENPVALRELAVQAGVLGRYEEAIYLWRRLLKREPGNAKALVNLSALLANAGHYAEAADTAARAVAAAPEMKEAVFNLARCRLLTGHAREAARAFARLTAAHPRYYPAVFLQGCAEICGGRPSAGMRTLRSLRSCPLWPALAHAFQELAEALVGAGQSGYAAGIRQAAERLGTRNDVTATSGNAPLGVAMGHREAAAVSA